MVSMRTVVDECADGGWAYEEIKSSPVVGFRIDICCSRLVNLVSLDYLNRHG